MHMEEGGDEHFSRFPFPPDPVFPKAILIIPIQKIMQHIPLLLHHVITSQAVIIGR